jgi:formamidopyrimidine-DNA glycosylase
MPELPEVETVVRGLRVALAGRTVAALRLGKTDFIEDPAALEATLPGARIEEVRRFGKFIGLRLSVGVAQNGARRLQQWLFVHLGMTGRLTISPSSAPVWPHTHVWFALDDSRELRYADPRRFGQMRLVDEAGLPAFLSRLGGEPLEISIEQFSTALGRRAMIKALLLNQSVFRGLGNIYTDESLWRARIHPRRDAAHLSKREQAALYRAMRKVLAMAIQMGGSSVSDYVDSDGNPGSFQLRHNAYGREGKPCRRCGVRIRRILVAGRSSYHCPQCQRAPRRRRARRTTRHL